MVVNATGLSQKRSRRGGPHHTEGLPQYEAPSCASRIKRIKRSRRAKTERIRKGTYRTVAQKSLGWRGLLYGGIGPKRIEVGVENGFRVIIFNGFVVDEGRRNLSCATDALAIL